MLNMFGRDYEEIGSLDRGLILKSSGKIKILYGKKLFDLLDSNGNLNIKVQQLIKKISFEKEIKDDGFYYYNNNLLAKVGNTILNLGSGGTNNTYVSFIEEQDATSEEKYKALKNIGFIYKTISDSNKYPKNGIIYVEDTNKLYIITNGKLSEYIAEIPNPYPKLFVISKSITDTNEGALLIDGDGKNNSIKFNGLKIYSRGVDLSVIEFDKEFLFYRGNKNVLSIDLYGLQTNEIKSYGGNQNEGYRIYQDSSGEYTLDIDNINIRNGLFNDNYFDDEFYSECFKIDYFYPVINSGIISEVLFNTNIRQSIKNGSIIEIPIRVIPITISNNTQIYNTIEYTEMLSDGEYSIEQLSSSNSNFKRTKSVPKEQIYRFRFLFNSNGNKLTFIGDNNSAITVSYNNKFKFDYDKSIRDAITINNVVYIFREPKINAAFRSRSGFVITKKDDTVLRIKMDFKEPYPEICLLKDESTSTYDLKIIVKIGNIDLYKTYTDYPEDTDGNSDTKVTGLYSTRNVLVGSEFRHEGSSVSDYMYPRYSNDLVKSLTEAKLVEPTYSNMILPRKWIPQAANYIEDLTAYSGTLETRDDNLYEGKLFLYKISGNSSNTLSVRFKLAPRYAVGGSTRINNEYTNYYSFYDRDSGTAIKEDYYRQGTTLLAQYKNGKIWVLRNPGIIYIKNNGTEKAKEPEFYDINFVNTNNIDLKVNFNSSTKVVEVKADISAALELRLATMESKISTLESKVSTLESKVSTLESDVSTLLSDVSTLYGYYSDLDSRVSTLESNSGGGNSNTIYMNDIYEMWVSSPSEGDVLTYKDGYWRNVTPSNNGGGGGGSISNLSDIGDVSSATPSNGDVLKWNGSSWAPGTDLTTSGGNGGDNGALSLSLNGSTLLLKENNTVLSSLDLTPAIVFNIDINGTSLDFYQGSNQNELITTVDLNDVSGLGGGGASRILDLSNVEYTGSPSTGDSLVWNGSKWTNTQLLNSTLQGINALGQIPPYNNQILIYTSGAWTYSTLPT